MLQSILDLDSKLFVFLNSKHNDFFDSIMFFFSYNTIAMGALVFFLIGIGFYFFKKSGFLIILTAILGFGSSDFISASILKPSFKRPRPCHVQELKEDVHLGNKNYCRGKYGFVSSHASNSFAISMIFWLLYRRQSRLFSLLFVYSAIVSYSRIYLGVHYPLDIIAGSGLGLMIGYLSYKLLFKFSRSSFE